MEKHGTKVVGQYDWTEITDNDITSATFQVTGAHDVRVMGTVGAVAPTDPDDGVVFVAKDFDGVTKRTMDDLFPGIAATRLYARSLNGGSKIFISHG